MTYTPGTRIAALLSAAGLLLALVLVLAGRAPEAAVAQDEKPAEQPNIVLIESDDQDLASMQFMPLTNKLIGEAGANFPLHISSWPLCCPARATLFTGQYAHNHGVLGNRDAPLGGFKNFKNETAMPVWLENAGYYTAHIGKYLNGYEGSEVGVPPGWTEWHGSKDTYKFYGYQLLEDGELVRYGDPNEDPDNPAQPETYIADVYTDKAVDIIEQRAPEKQPFFLSVGHLAPHSGAPQPNQNSGPSQCVGTAKPAARHLNDLVSAPIPAPPNFNEADTTDKPNVIRRRPPLSDEQLARIARNYRCRMESLLAIDESVGAIIDALRKSGELENTLVIYTSDNGFFHGEHRIPNGKNRVYEEAIKVPLMMRGPGIDRGISVDELTINTDLAATIADYAGADPLVRVDGRSLVKLMDKPRHLFGREVLIEQFSSIGEDGEEDGIQYKAVRTHRYKYVENATGELELYDLELDPYELQNQKDNPAYDKIQIALAKRLDVLRECAAKSCREKPRIQLKIKGEKKVKRDKKGKKVGFKNCFKPNSIRAKVKRKSGETQPVEVTFRVNGKKTGVREAKPFEQRIRPNLLKSGGKRPQITATTMLLDGRGLTLTKETKVCK
jgi:N-acetylglucosamine-6-sulfatase